MSLHYLYTHGNTQKSMHIEYEYSTHTQFTQIQYARRLFHEPNLFEYRTEPYFWQTECILVKRTFFWHTGIAWFGS
jgi:hypothetical protein